MKKLLVYMSISLFIFLSGQVFNQETQTEADLKDMALANTEIISVAPSALRPKSLYDGFALDFRAGADGAYYGVPNGNITAYAPLNLPHGSTVTKFTACFTDNSGSGYMNITLERRNIQTGTVETMTNLGSMSMRHPSGRKKRMTKSIANALIENNKYTYHIKWYTHETTPGLIFHAAFVLCKN